MKRAKKLIAFLLVLCMAIAMNVTTFAASDANSAVAEARSGVFQVRLYVLFEQGGDQYEDCIGVGSGLLLGPSSGAETVITNDHVISVEGLEDEIREAYGVTDFDTEIRIAVKRDVEIKATYLNGSEASDYAILKLEQPIYNKTPLRVRSSSKVSETQPVYALGFPAIQSQVEDYSVYTTEDVTVTDGIVNKFNQYFNTNYITHTATISSGNSGGPLVDSTGAVIGVNTIAYGEFGSAGYSGAIAIDEITSVLDALGFAYVNADEVEETPTPAPTDDVVDEPVDDGPVAPVVDKSALNSKLAEATALVPSEYTEESWNALQTAITAAQGVVNNASATQDEVNAQVSAVQTAIGALEAKPATNWALIGGAAAGVVVLIVIIVVIASSSKKSKKKAPATPAGGAPVPPAGAPVPPARPAGAPVPPTFGGTMPMDTGAGETSVLGGGAGETSVLGGGAMQPAATLIRKKNGETATIAKQMFIIGKERSKVDFCIPDNNSVSRNHANIVCKGGVYYIVDKNSTNFTFVNGNKITPNQEVKLNSGDKIKLADEEFEFRM